MRKCWRSNTKNPHHYDKISKNRLSKFVSIRCPNAHGYRITGSRQGHQVRTEGHRIASGIVRQKVKEETRSEIQFSFSLDE